MTLPQAALFLPGSIRHNMTTWSMTQYGGDSQETDELIEAALRKVHLWDTLTAHQLNSPQPHQSEHGIPISNQHRAILLDAELDPETSLSHGQRQLFCLARMLFQRRGAQIVLLDEISSSVDQDSERLMQEILKQELIGKTVVQVAHRLDSIMDYDTVVVMDQGRIVERDSPETLLGIKNSAFKALWDSGKYHSAV